MNQSYGSIFHDLQKDRLLQYRCNLHEIVGSNLLHLFMLHEKHLVPKGYIYQ